MFCWELIQSCDTLLGSLVHNIATLNTAHKLRLSSSSNIFMLSTQWPLQKCGYLYMTLMVTRFLLTDTATDSGAQTARAHRKGAGSLALA